MIDNYYTLLKFFSKGNRMDEDSNFSTEHVQWTTSDNVRFFPASQSVSFLLPAVYKIKNHMQRGIYFEKVDLATEDLIKFPEANGNKVVDEIQKFWTVEDLYKSYNLPYKRGILMYGPPGGGKSCTIKILMKDVIDRGGIGLIFNQPDLFIDGFRLVREIQPHVPIVVLMEDIDAIVEDFSESEVLNILDGAYDLNKVVFLATTNYPERLGDRILNRPSRFDKRYKIPNPDKVCRRIYLENLIEKVNLKIDPNILEKSVEETDGMSLAHLKELFISVFILEEPLAEALNVLRDMCDEHPDSLKDSLEENPMAFGDIVSKRKC